MQSPNPRESGKDGPGALLACPLCALPQHLERPRIDDEATLVWLPEMSQQAVNSIMREIHIQLRALGEDLKAGSVFRKNTANHRSLYHAREVLAERTRPAIERIGTSSLRDLGLALLELSPAAYAHRATLLGGVRLLPLGQFYEGDRDIYPEIVDAWRETVQMPDMMANNDAHRPPLGKG